MLLPVAGILDVLDNYSFLRTSGYLPGPNDVYVSQGQVKKYGLRKGDAVVGSIKQPNGFLGHGCQNAGQAAEGERRRSNSLPCESVGRHYARCSFGPSWPLAAREAGSS